MEILPSARVFHCFRKSRDSFFVIPQSAHLPSHWIQLSDFLAHVLLPVVGVDDRVDLEGYPVGAAPLPDDVEGVKVVRRPLTSTNLHVSDLTEAVTRDGEDIQVLPCIKCVQYCKKLKNDYNICKSHAHHI